MQHYGSVPAVGMLFSQNQFIDLGLCFSVHMIRPAAVALQFNSCSDIFML